MADRDREMEDAWQSRCASQWPPPLVETLASGHSSQMRMNPHNTFHSFVAQEAPLQEHLIVQEPFVLNTLNLGLYKSGHTEGGNPVVSLLSGHVHHLPSTFSHLMNPGSAEPKLHSQNEVSTLCGTSSCIPSCSVSYGNDAIGNGRLSPFVASRPLLLSTGTTAPVLHNNIQVAGSHYHGPDLVMHQAIQANDRGLMVSSVKQNWPDVSDTANASQYHTLHIQTSKESPLEVKSATSGRATSGVAGRLHVYCLNTIGELFVNDMGLLGITCFCHSTNMSVANFCEHSGSSSANPGDAVHIENGLTLAQWCKLSFGPRALASGIWNWPTSSSAKGGSHGLNPSNLPNISKNLGSYQSPEASIGFGRSGESLNKFTYNNHLHPGAVGSYAMGKSANSFVNIACQRNTPNQPDFFRNFSGTPPSVMPALANNHSVQSVKGSPVIINFEASNSNGNKGEQNMGYQLVGDNVNYTSKCGNPSIIYPCSSTKKSLDNDFNIRSNFSSGQFVPDWSGAPSNVELRLGQPYQKSHTLLDSIPKSKHPQQFGAHFDLPKQQFHQPLTRGTICPREANKPWPNLQCTLPEASTPERRNLQHATSSASACNLSEPEETTGIAAKNSAISLFLSHLNYIEGNNLSHSTDNILNDTENVVMGEYDDDSTKCNLPNFRRDMNDATEGKSTINKSNISSRMEKGKELRVDDVGSYNSLKQDYLIKKKHTRDFEVPSPNVVGHYPYLTSLNDGQSTSYLHQELRPGVWNSEKCEEVSFMGESDHCDHLIHRSVNSIPCLTARCCSLNSKSPMSLSPTNPMFCSEPTPALSNVKDNHMTQNLLDENLSFLALRSMAELSKQERSTQALETSHQHGRMCCLSSTEVQRSARKDDLMAPEELREMPYCTVQKDGSSVAVRSVYPCSNCYYGSSVKPSMTCPKKCCKCTAVEQRISLSDKEHGIHSPSCIVCCSDRQALLRLGRFSNNNAMEGVKHEMYNQKERRPSFPGKCSCTLSTCLAACISGDSPCACKELEVCRKANTLPFNDDRSFKDNKIMKQGRCECSRKHVIMSNDSQSALWRNIPSEVIGQSDAVLIEEPAKVLEATGVVDQPTEASVKEYDKACEQHELMKEQQMSNACSESSAPAITEISSETNKVGFCAAEVGNAKSICDFVVDEGSGIEKCGSSDEALDNQEWEEAISFRNKVDSVCLFEEHKLQSSSTSKNVKNQKKSGFIIQEEINQMQRMCREEKLKGPMKWKRLDACNPISGLSIVNADCLESIGHHSSSKGIKAPVQQDNRKTSCVFFCKASGAKRKRSTRSLKRFENHHKVQGHGKTESSDDCSPKVMRLSALKKVKQDLVVDGKKESVKQKDNHETSGKPPKYMSLGCIGNSPNHGMDSYVVKVKPVVCGNSGIISNVLGSEQKPPKIVSLSVILKTARRCNISKDEWKPELSSVSETKKVRLSANTRRCSELSWKKQSQNGDSNVFLRSRKGPRFLIMPGVNKICSSKGDGCVDEVSAMKRGTDCENLRTLKHGDHHDYIDSQPRYDGTRKRSLSELTGEDMHAAKSTCLSSIGENSNLIIAGTELEKPPSQCITDSLIGRDLHCEKSCSGKILDSASPRNIGVISKSQFYRDHEQCQINMRRCSKRRKCQPFVFNSDAFCCVCGSSNKEEGNNLLECFHCLIRVHQACYGIPKAPKDRWCCRPCKANAKNIVCVLCGYEGGAMTRALKSRNVVKSLLKVWKIGIDSKPGKSVPPKMSKFPEPGLLGKTSGDNGSSLLALVGSASSGDVLRYSPKMDLQSRTNMFRQMDILSSYQSHNSITAGMLDPSVIQWVHMVCGLWTPGTKCPNVDTMSAFDVSGASPARKNTVCSICNRPGGSCIRCRVLNCTVNFHPWCAHQKGLLQSEVEGVDNEKVGFYGRCMLHVMHNSFHVDGSMDVEVGSSIQKDFSCARVEGFKGRKRDEGYKPHFQKPYNGGGCIVSQDQINAWIHINGQKSCTRSVVKPACSDIEYDFRKEYIRYKQAKGWRHLVVYKSGIHALGLYTSQFIARGAMVVEYVGEIVGLRVADKREIEYQSGRKMQYKSACYFFRIDKEHIIDATRKGGIARFVNHSCLPNCVAKIISIRNEKKVVFFAERDINPGEEITYDYHFNHEDEGQKIPCFCNSKNCRRYLN